MKNYQHHAFVLLSVVLPLVAPADDWYVARSGIYVDDQGVEHTAKTSIADAIDWNSGAQAGDTVWIEDGYVENATSVSTDHGIGRLYIRRGVTLRSKSGTYDEAKGLGVTLIGAPHSETTAVGKDAIRCCTVANRNGGTTVLQGFIFRNGCSEADYGGGALYDTAGTIVVTNCLFRDNTGKIGGAVCGSATVCYACVFSNNVATVSGGATYRASLYDCTVISNRCSGCGGGVYGADVVSNCLVALNVQSNNGSSNGGAGIWISANGQEVIKTVVSNNWAVAYGGGIDCYQYGAVISNCTLIGNLTGQYLDGTGASYGNGGGVYCQKLSYGAKAYDCTFVENTAYQRGYQGQGGGAYCVTLVGGTVRNNIATAYGGGCSDCVLTDVRVVDNVTTNASEQRGGGLYQCVATNCLIAGNVVYENKKSGYGGGAYNATLVRCTVSNNTAKSYGGGVYWSSGSYGPLINCTIVDNACGDQGGGVYSSVSGATLCNCFIARNRGDSNVGAGGAQGYTYQSSSTPITLVNCTVTGNDGGPNRTSGVGGVRHANLVNTIVWGNTAKNAEIADVSVDGVLSATNCTCSVDLSAKGEGNSTADPKLSSDCRLKARSSCRGTGYYDADEMPWASDPSDPRHLDLAGKPRLTDGRIDRGCYTYVPLSGLTLLVR